MALLSYFKKGLIEAGCDEAGRGCLAGPVFAASVILPNDFYHPLLNDSKQLNEQQRALLRPIIEKEALAFAVAQVSPQEIDEINILKSTHAAMARAAKKLKQAPDYCLIDGLPVSGFPIPSEGIVNGGGKSLSIAAASILAKTHRDAYLDTLHKAYPVYGWNKNKGYGTAVHRAAIEVHGLCEHHRKSFAILPTPPPLL